MAKKDIHPEYHTIIVKTTDGGEFKTKSCYGKEGSVIVLDLDPYNHPAWKDGKQSFVNTKDDQIAKFNKKYGSFKFQYILIHLYVYLLNILISKHISLILINKTALIDAV